MAASDIGRPTTQPITNILATIIPLVRMIIKSKLLKNDKKVKLNVTKVESLNVLK